MTDERPRLLIIAGPNGSGKSSLITATGIDTDYGPILNPDNYARGLDIEDDLERYDTAIRKCAVLRERLLESGETFGFETVASKKDKLDYIRRAKAEGYAFDMVFVTAGSPENCCSRIEARVLAGGHDVPRDKVFSRYGRTMNNLHDYLALADRAEVFDNSGDRLVHVLAKRDGAYILSEGAESIEWVKKYIVPYI